ncbi:hypothetical protein L8P27_19520 [Enterobacter asburiae]|uniref:hypothetical protein n=1 Tax=Enterobacter asburiae TaxID=61645 RepID=UPI0020066AD5|nr:hypothetical protein [Enterobacter asburiae]MCK7229996.1 hypothetical protein [Enterobacter asburiae]
MLIVSISRNDILYIPLLSMDYAVLIDADVLMWIYRTGDFKSISNELNESVSHMTNFPDLGVNLHLKMSIVTHLQLIGMTYKKPELQQLSIVALCSKKNWQLKAALKDAILLMEDIIA